MGCLLSGSMVGLKATSSKRAYATYCVFQVCCSQRLCPRHRPLLACTSTGDTQTLKGRSASVSVGPLGPGTHKILFKPSKHLWQECGVILNAFHPFYQLVGTTPLPWTWGIFFGGIQHSPINDCSAVSCNFGFLAGDEHMFYTTILAVVICKEGHN